VFNGPGTLIDTVASTTGGCDTARTITITTAPLLTTTVSATVWHRLPATYFGHVFNGPATLIDTVASTTGGCDTARTITITTAPLLTQQLVQQYVLTTSRQQYLVMCLMDQLH
jgi:hypothetical protein